MILKKIGKFALIFAVSTMLLTGCSSNSGSISSISGYSLDTKTFENEVNLFRAYHKLVNGETVSTEQTEEYAEIIANKLANIEMLYKEGKKAGFEPSEDTLNEELNNINASIDEIKGLREILELYGYDQTNIKDSVRKSLTMSSYQESLYDDVAVSNKDIEEYYEKNKDKSYSYTVADAAHILFKTFSTDSNGDMVSFSEKDKLEVKKRAQAVLDKLNNGEDFNKLAKEYSEDEGTKKDGGELGEFQTGDMVTEFEEATFALKKGETSGLVESPYGYHIIKLNSKDTSYYPLTDSNVFLHVRENILGDSYKDSMISLQNKYKFKVNKDNITPIIKNLKPIELPRTTNSNSDTKDTSTKENKDTTKDKESK